MSDLYRIEHIIRHRAQKIREEIETARTDRSIGWGRYETLQEAARQLELLADDIAKSLNPGERP